MVELRGGKSVRERRGCASGRRGSKRGRSAWRGQRARASVSIVGRASDSRYDTHRL